LKHFLQFCLGFEESASLFCFFSELADRAWWSHDLAGFTTIFCECVM
jgi:hypothetical protein